MVEHRATEALRAAMGHPVQAQILAELADAGDQSAAEIAGRIGVPVRSVRHQLSRLAARGLIEVSASRSRRGALEKLYDIRAAPAFEKEAHERMRPEESRRIAIETFRRVVVDVTRALVAGGFDWKDSSLIRLGTEVDEEGWAEIARTIRRAYDEIEEAGERAALRLRRGEEEPRRGISVLLWFERPNPDDPDWESSQHPPPWARRTAMLPDPAATLDGPQGAPTSRLAAAMGHPVRARILFALSDTHPLGVAQVAERIREPPRRVRYHLGRLVADGLVEHLRSEDRTPGRYALLRIPILESGDLARLTSAETRRIATEIFRRIAVDAARAISSGTFYARSDFCETRVPLVADAEGWAEVQAISLAAFGRVETASAAATARLAESGALPIATTVAILWFELPRH